ncbi:MAG TPA: hypothetical protein VGN37_04855 [Actinocatenispora sp.]
MSTTYETGSAAERAWYAGAWLGSGIGALFGLAWCWFLGAGSLPGTAAPLAVRLAGVAVTLGVLAGSWSLRRRYGTGSGGGSPFGRRYWIAVVAMVAAIVLGNLLLRQVLHEPQAVPAWILLVVGLHFVPFGTRTFRWLAAALAAVAVLAAVLGLAGFAAGWTTVVGLGGAATLWAFSAAGLLRAHRVLGRPAGAR